MYLDQLFSKMNNVIHSELNNHNIHIETTNEEKTNVLRNNIQFSIFKKELYQKTKVDKFKPSNMNKKEIQTVFENENEVDIFNDDIFVIDKNDNNSKEKKKDKIKFMDFDKNIRDKKIRDFIEHKNIEFDEVDTNLLNDLINDDNFKWDQFITMNNNDIFKIKFIKKNEYGLFFIEFDDPDEKKIKKSFFKK